MSNTNTSNEVSPTSVTVESLKDVENSTCCIDSFKNRPTFAINKESAYPFSFGMLKAKLIVKHMDKLKKFVESNGVSLS